MSCKKESLLVLVSFVLVLFGNTSQALIDEQELTQLIQAEITKPKTHTTAPVRGGEMQNEKKGKVVNSLDVSEQGENEGVNAREIKPINIEDVAPSVPPVDMTEVITRMREQGLTNATSVTLYRPDERLTRQAMAKFASVFALLMKKQREHNPNCGFKDIYTAQTDLIPYIISACSMGVMKGVNGYAYPTKTLSKGEAIAILMRIVRNDIKQEGNPRYKSYYEVARAYGITYASLKDMENTVTRGEIAIMMRRAFKMKF